MGRSDSIDDYSSRLKADLPPSYHAEESHADSTRQYLDSSRLDGSIARMTLRVLQFIFAMIIAGLYGTDLARATRHGDRASASFVYAEVVAALSILTCAVHCFAAVNRMLWCFWDFILCVLWAALFGVFGSMYLGSDAADENKKSQDVQSTGSLGRMRAAIWIDMIGMFLWALTFVQAILWCCNARKVKQGHRLMEDMAEKQELGRDVAKDEPRLEVKAKDAL